MDIMRNIKTIIDKMLEKVLIFLMSGMVLSILWQVITRYLFNAPSDFTDELSRYLLIWLGIFGAAYVTGQKKHISLDFFVNKFFKYSKKSIDMIIQFLILFFSLAIFLIGGLRLVYITLSLGQISSALNIPLGYVYMVIPVSGIIIAFYSLYFIFELKKFK